MRTGQIGALLFFLTASLGLTACGGAKIGSAIVSPVAPVSPQTPPTTLSGNWLLAGSRVPAVYPVISALLDVQGNNILGTPALFAQCTAAGGTSSVSGGGVPLSGTIANDGTFQASTGTIGGPPLSTLSLALTGNSPLAATPSVWTGTYSLAFTPSPVSVGPCSLSQTAPFTATPIASLTGTYLGVPASTGPTPGPFGAGSVVSVQITQGLPTLIALGKTNRYMIPLTASLTVTNSACPVSVSTTGVPEPSSLAGDSFTLFLTPGFPYGFLDGMLDDPSAKSFAADLTSLASVSGCPGIAFYHFTRQ